jgi:hypothetical protein
MWRFQIEDIQYSLDQIVIILFQKLCDNLIIVLQNLDES